jgi:hypothetical protein
MLNQASRAQLWKKISLTSERMDKGIIGGHSTTRQRLNLKILLSFQMRFLPLHGKTENPTRYGPQLTSKITWSSMGDGVCIISPLPGRIRLTFIAVEVHQIPFVWDLTMSVKLDAHSNVIGSYEPKDLSWFYWPPKKRSGQSKPRERFRLLTYELVWNITEMQVKTFVRAIIPHPTGPLTMQLAKERPLGPQEFAYGESRSQALVKDIQVSAKEAAHAAPVARPRQLTEKGRKRERPAEQDQRLDDLPRSSRRTRSKAARTTDDVQTARPVAQMTSGKRILPPPRKRMKTYGQKSFRRAPPADPA